MIRVLIAYWFFFITNVVVCIQRPKLIPPLTRLLGFLYSLIAFIASLLGLWLWLYPPFWKGIIVALLMLAAGALCFLATKLLRYTYLASIIWIIVAAITFLANNLLNLKIILNLLISFPPIMLAGLTLLSIRNFKS